MKSPLDNTCSVGVHSIWCGIPSALFVRADKRRLGLCDRLYNSDISSTLYRYFSLTFLSLLITWFLAHLETIVIFLLRLYVFRSKSRHKNHKHTQSEIRSIYPDCSPGYYCRHFLGWYSQSVSPTLLFALSRSGIILVHHYNCNQPGEHSGK